MPRHLILWPLLAQVLLVFLVYIVMAKRKGRARKAGDVDLAAAAIDNKAWPLDVVLTSNNLANQFQLPVLFYVLCLTLWALDAVSMPALALAALFSASRYCHAFVHMGKNHVPTRFSFFAFGFLMLLGLWGVAITALVAAG